MIVIIQNFILVSLTSDITSYLIRFLFEAAVFFYFMHLTPYRLCHKTDRVSVYKSKIFLAMIFIYILSIY